MTKARQSGLLLGLLSPQISEGLAALLAWLAVPRGLVTGNTPGERKTAQTAGLPSLRGLSLCHK